MKISGKFSAELAPVDTHAQSCSILALWTEAPIGWY